MIVVVAVTAAIVAVWHFMQTTVVTIYGHRKLPTNLQCRVCNFRNFAQCKWKLCKQQNETRTRRERDEGRAEQSVRYKLQIFHALDAFDTSQSGIAATLSYARASEGVRPETELKKKRQERKGKQRVWKAQQWQQLLAAFIVVGSSFSRR